MNIKAILQSINQEINDLKSINSVQKIEINDYLYSYLDFDDDDLAQIQFIKFSNGSNGDLQ